MTPLRWPGPRPRRRRPGAILIAGIAAMLITIFLGAKFIEFLRAREFGQQISEEGPEGHHAKAGTPTMGGLIVFIAMRSRSWCLALATRRSLAVFGVAPRGWAALGFADDFIKVTKKRSLGLPARWKLLIPDRARSSPSGGSPTEQVGLDPRIQVAHLRRAALPGPGPLRDPRLPRHRRRLRTPST